MEEPTRVWKTFACLVVSMTCTATVLGWLDTSPNVTNGPLRVELIRTLAESVVQADVEVAPERWQDIRIVQAPARAISSAQLTAKAATPDAHFLITPDGRPARTHYWGRQLDVAKRPHTITIHVALGAESVWGQPQAVCAQELIAAIGRALAVPVDELPVSMDPSLVAAQSDYELVSASDFTG